MPLVKATRAGFGGDGFLSVVRDGIVGERAGGIEEDVVRSPVARGADAQCKLVARREIDINFGVGGVAHLSGGIFSGERGELRGCGEDQRLIAGFVVAGSVGSGAGLRDDLRTAVQKFDNGGNVKVMLVESGEEEDFIFLERAADSASGLLLAVVRLEGEEGVGGAEGAVAQKIKSGAVPVIRSRFGDDVDHCAAGAAEFGSVRIRGDAEFLHHFGGELVGSAVASASLSEEGVVEVAAIDQKTVLETAQAAEREIAVGGGGKAARIGGHAGREQHEIAEAAAIEREVADGALRQSGWIRRRVGFRPVAARR